MTIRSVISADWRTVAGAFPHAVLCVLLAAVALSGCGTNAPGVGSADVIASDQGRTVLSAEQTMLVETTVKTMAAKEAGNGNAIPGNARFSSVVAIEKPSEKAVHVCGYVDQAGLGSQKRFYVELRRAAGEDWTAHRGQIAIDAARSAKVQFVCREHDNGRPDFPEVVR